jgi:gas vesicle protein
MEWLVSHIEFIFSIIGVLIGALATLVYADVVKMKEEQQRFRESHAKDIDGVKQSMGDIKNNYLDRFADLKDTFKSEIEGLSKEIHEARLAQEREFLRKSECPLIHTRGDHEKG